MKEYIGDGVYVGLKDGGEVILTAEDGIGVTDIIYLEVPMLDKIKKVVENFHKSIHPVDITFDSVTLKADPNILK